MCIRDRSYKLCFNIVSSFSVAESYSVYVQLVAAVGCASKNKNIKINCLALTLVQCQFHFLYIDLFGTNSFPFFFFFNFFLTTDCFDNEVEQWTGLDYSRLEHGVCFYTYFLCEHH